MQLTPSFPAAATGSFPDAEPAAIEKPELQRRTQLATIEKGEWAPCSNVTDAYADGAGQLSVRLLGYPIVRRTGPAITVGEALRYLAELPLVPDAMDSNRQLRWRDLGAAAVEVSTVVHGRRLAVMFDFDESGDPVRASTGARPHDRKGGFDLVPWAG